MLATAHSAHHPGWGRRQVGRGTTLGRSGGYSLLAVVVAEVVLTGFFLYVIAGANDTLAPRGFAPLAIGLSLTLIHLAIAPPAFASPATELAHRQFRERP